MYFYFSEYIYMYIYKLYYNVVIVILFLHFFKFVSSNSLLDNPNLSLPDVEIQLLVNPNLS